jgi:hypothetical protein
VVGLEVVEYEYARRADNAQAKGYPKSDQVKGKRQSPFPSGTTANCRPWLLAVRAPP